jgi:lipoate-protein ligase A
VPEPIRLLIDPPQDGVWNMSLDEALLNSVAAGESPDTLRFYQWRPATLSLGYFQPFSDRQLHAASMHCAVVRRSSGGGAIVHDQELTYSLVLRVAERFAARELYSLVHEGLRAILAARAIEASIFEEGQPKREHESSFLCFERRANGDVVSRGSKICGSAQRRLGSTVLQHGSLLLAQSEFAPELPGLAELWDASPNVEGILEAWKTEMGQRLGRPLIMANWKPQELANARLWADQRYGSSDWQHKR